VNTRRTRIVDWATAVYEDLDFAETRRWLDDGPRRTAVGILPVYAPREAALACGMLPVGIHGGGDQIDIVKGDAYYQSYICHLPRSVVELAESGRLDFLSAALFPSTCDVIRNLSGIWMLRRPDLYVRYVDVPHVTDAATGEAFWEGEIRTLLRDLGEISGRAAGDDAVRAAIDLLNRTRSAVRELYRVRRETPWRIPTEELYLLMRAGEVVPPEVFLEQAEAYLAATEVEPGRRRDNTRVVIIGSFCEQPPLGLIKTIERAGCYIVDDDFLVGNRFLTRDVPLTGDPVKNLARAFVRHGTKCSVIFEEDPAGKRNLVRERVEAAAADGVIFAAASFCDPALLDQPMLRDGAEAAGIPCIAFKFSENTGQFQQFREQAGTFSDSIKLWGEV
jgi:benzoyl-CoA reductase subunit C